MIYCWPVVKSVGAHLVRHAHHHVHRVRHVRHVGRVKAMIVAGGVAVGGGTVTSIVCYGVPPIIPAEPQWVVGPPDWGFIPPWGGEGGGVGYVPGGFGGGGFGAGGGVATDVPPSPFVVTERHAPPTSPLPPLDVTRVLDNTPPGDTPPTKTPVPEPSTYASFALGGLLYALYCVFLKRAPRVDRPDDGEKIPVERIHYKVVSMDVDEAGDAQRLNRSGLV